MPLYPPLYTNPPPPLPDIDVSNPDAHRAAFHHTDYDSTLPLIRARFPNIDPVYIAKIYRGTIHPEGLIWLDVDRQDASPPNFSDLAHLLYCFEVYGQILCILTDPHGGAKEVEMQRALTDYRLRSSS
ncbi:MAG: hypothetical protein ALECFALPRED_000612 [Alectoria fallacina]|uniref:Uncharacterized protein n=1 Tax=Alectoria fallacina TaxID=1903189 RepID=A0A8H3EJZ9_9LECA|nr:MAG: hypothetical protein ALECFALPRED_000612 [Alectoria fallacina]